MIKSFKFISLFLFLVFSLFSSSEAFSATTFSFSGPSIGANGVASSNFTVTPDSSYTGNITITPSGGGLSTPIVLTFSGSSTPQTFTITPAELGVITLTPTNNGGLINPSVVSYNSTNYSGVVVVDQGDLWENGYDNVGNPRQSVFSFVRLNTDATVIRVTGTTTNHLVAPTGYDVLDIRVDGADHSQVIFPANGSYTSNNIVLPAGEKTIEIITGTQNRPSASPILGTFIDSFELLDFTNYSVSTPTTSGRLLVYGDSISVGYSDVANRGHNGWTSLIRNAGRKLMNEGYSRRELRHDAVDSDTRTAFVSRVSGYAPDVIWMAIGVNDYFRATWSAATFGLAYAALLDDLHAALPDAVIYCQTPTVQITENANGLGDTLGAFRTQISTACLSRPWTTLVDGSVIYSTSDMYTDNVHPTTAGHIKYANFVKPYVAIDGGVSVSLSSASGVIGATVTATLTRALGSTFINGDQMTIDWGDGTTSSVTPNPDDTTVDVSHAYLSEGSRNISITNNQNWPNPSSVTYVTLEETRSRSSGGGSSRNTRNKNTVNKNTTPVETFIVYGSSASVVRSGSSGESAKDVQRAVNQLKAVTIPLVVDGKIGKKSIAGIMLVQKMLGTKVDGIWGKNTQKAYESFLVRF